MENTVKSIVEQHPDGVALLFSRYELDAEVTQKNLNNAIRFFGDPFIQDLQDITKNNQVSSFLGLFPSREERERRKAERDERKTLRLAEGKKPLDLPDLIGKGLGILGILTGKGQDEDPPEDENSKPPSRILGINKALFIGLIVLVAILFIARKK